MNLGRGGDQVGNISISLHTYNPFQDLQATVSDSDFWSLKKIMQWNTTHQAELVEFR